MRPRLRPARLCATCGKPLITAARKWHWRCVPTEARSDWCRKANRTQALKRRRAKFKAALDRLVTERGTLTAEGLLDFAAKVLDQGWHLGYSACERKWERRQRQQGKAA